VLPLLELSFRYLLKELQETYSIGQVERVKPEHSKKFSVNFKVKKIFSADGEKYHFQCIER